MASLQRWGRNDGMGQKLMDFTKSIEAHDAKTIVLTLKEPYGLVLDSIAKPSSLRAVHDAEAPRRDAGRQGRSRSRSVRVRSSSCRPNSSRA